MRRLEYKSRSLFDICDVQDEYEKVFQDVYKKDKKMGMREEININN